MPHRAHPDRGGGGGAEGTAERRAGEEEAECPAAGDETEEGDHAGLRFLLSSG